MKRIFALGACALLTLVSAPTVVHAAPAPNVVATANAAAVGVLTDNVTWDNIVIPAGSTVIVSYGTATATSDLTVTFITPNGVVTDNVTWDQLATLEDNVTWGN